MGSKDTNHPVLCRIRYDMSVTARLSHVGIRRGIEVSEYTYVIHTNYDLPSQSRKIQIRRRRAYYTAGYLQKSDTHNVRANNNKIRRTPFVGLADVTSSRLVSLVTMLGPDVTG